MKKIVINTIVVLIGIIFIWSVNPARVSSQYEGIVHTVKKGDTLWDISAQYFGDSAKWPEIWESNRYLTNPNYIYPGLEIVISPPPPVTGEYEYAVDKKAPKQMEKVIEKSADDEQEVEKLMAKLKLGSKDILSSGELVRGKPEKVGSIVETTAQKLLFSPGERLYLDLAKDYPLGTELGIYRVEGPVSVKGIREKAYKKKYIGKVKIVEKSGTRVIGSITELFEEAFRIDFLDENIPEAEEFSLRYLDDKLVGEVITSSGDNPEFAEGDSLYIKGGREMGFDVGDVVNIYVHLKTMQKLTATPFRIEMTEEGNLVYVARAVIIRVNDDFSTIFVVDSLISFDASAVAVRGNL